MASKSSAIQFEWIKLEIKNVVKFRKKLMLRSSQMKIIYWKVINWWKQATWASWDLSSTQKLSNRFQLEI